MMSERERGRWTRKAGSLRQRATTTSRVWWEIRQLTWKGRVRSRREEEGLLEMGRKDPRSSSKDETQGLEGKGKEEDEEEDGKAGGDGDRPRTQEVEMKEERAEDKQEARNASSGGQREQRGGGA
eukprot:2412753-Rhodomonas_salina.2